MLSLILLGARACCGPWIGWRTPNWEPSTFLTLWLAMCFSPRSWASFFFLLSLLLQFPSFHPQPHVLSIQFALYCSQNWEMGIANIPFPSFTLALTSDRVVVPGPSYVIRLAPLVVSHWHVPRENVFTSTVIHILFVSFPGLTIRNAD